MTPDAAVSAEDLRKSYRVGPHRVDALRGATLRVARGEFVAVMGPSGSGKSTLLHLLGQLDTPDSGRIRFGPVDPATLDDDGRTALRRDRIGFVFQSFELLPYLSARENVLLPAEAARRRAAGEVRLRELATRLGLDGRLDHRPAGLSGGERQRVALARALINGPDLLLADEPTGNLDRASGDAVLRLLRDGVDHERWTVVMVTHDPHAARVADRVVFLEHGRTTGSVATDAPDARSRIADATGA